MFTYLPNPLNSAVLHFAVGANAFGDGLCDDRLFQLFVFLNGGAGFLYDGINVDALGVEEVGDCLLFGKRRNENWLILKLFETKCFSNSCTHIVKSHSCFIALKQVGRVQW